jgi:hypothetical protein
MLDRIIHFYLSLVYHIWKNLVTFARKYKNQSFKSNKTTMKVKTLTQKFWIAE